MLWIWGKKKQTSTRKRLGANQCDIAKHNFLTGLFSISLSSHTLSGPPSLTPGGRRVSAGIHVGVHIGDVWSHPEHVEIQGGYDVVCLWWMWEIRGSECHKGYYSAHGLLFWWHVSALEHMTTNIFVLWSDVAIINLVFSTSDQFSLNASPWKKKKNNNKSWWGGLTE